MKVFLSYAVSDRLLAERISLALRAQRHDVFVDRSVLDPGQDFDERIRKAIEDADRFVFLISPDSLTSGRIPSPN